ncbi:MAG TPA: C40 family peptidase [Gemmatimonadales bacterium]|nr:C40 family peptidase [Gemmatimonadales bacterium]
MNRSLLLLPLVAATPLHAQGLGFQVGHLFTSPSATSYRLGYSSELMGVVGTEFHALASDGDRPLGNLWGAGMDLSLFRGGQPGFYLLGGVEGGFATQASHTFWGSWSAGLGYEVFPLHGVSFAVEGRYRALGPGAHHGVEMGIRLGLDRGSRDGGGGGGGSSSRDPAAVDRSAPDTATIRGDLGRRGLPEDRASLISGVIQTALDVMGMPYRWGDQGEEGFDCSGLIRYAFAKHGITLPRRSIDQAREGLEVGRDVDALRPGDVLTFATTGSQVSHVGLYIGDGKFIHSASEGVQISVLSPEDVSGRWWFKRWVGARRIVS